MSKLNKAIIGGQMKVRMAAQSAKEWLVQKRKGEGNGVIIAVIMLVIGIGLAITFRDAISNWLTTFTGYFDHELNKFTTQ